MGHELLGSRFLNGTLALHEELEHRLAKFVNKKAALCFSTGYQTNLGAISALVGKGEHVVTDKLNHASIMDGIFMAIGHARPGLRAPLPAQQPREPREEPEGGARGRARCSS